MMVILPYTYMEYKSKEQREAAELAIKKQQEFEHKNNSMIRYGLNNPKWCPFFIPKPDGWYTTNPESFMAYNDFATAFGKWFDERNKKNSVK